jgi:hypothetical protein
MPWLKKKIDPISDRAAALTAEIAALESQIKKLGSKLEEKQTHPRLRSTALPHGPTVPRASMPSAHPPPAPAHEPIFEEVDQDRLKARGEVAMPEHYNDLGVRKYDLPALFQRVRNHFRGPATTNPRLVSYLAAGGVQGLRPLRYEKRVARNRFLLLAAFLFFTLLGFILVFWPHH